MAVYMGSVAAQGTRDAGGGSGDTIRNSMPNCRALRDARVTS